MSCKVVEFPGGRAIVCGVRERRPRAEKCYSCDAPGVCQCDWPVMRVVRSAWTALKPGEAIFGEWGSWYDAAGNRRSGSPGAAAQRYRVIAVHPLEGDAVRLTILGPKGGSKEITRSGSASCAVEREKTCDRHACRVHSVHIGKNLDYCMEHHKSSQQPPRPVQTGLDLGEPTETTGKGAAK